MAQSKSKSVRSIKPASAVAAGKVPASTPVVAAAPKAPVKTVAPKMAAPKPVVAKPAAPKVEAPVVVETAPVVETPVIAPQPLPETAPVLEIAPVIEPAAEPVLAAPEPEPIPAAPTITAPAPAIKTPILKFKDITMTTDFTAQITETMTDAVSEVQAKLQTAYDKSTVMATEMTDLAKGNVEAVVESTKLFAAGVQDMGKTYADEAKSAYETATADLKEMAAIKSPTELFQLQGKIMRRNFDMFVAATSKSSDAAIKLANEAMAPISGRVNLAAEKLSKIAA